MAHISHTFFLITVNIKILKPFRPVFLSRPNKMDVNQWNMPLQLSLHAIAFKLTSDFFCVGDGFCSPTSFFTYSQIIGFEVSWQKAEIRSAEVHIIN